VAAVPGVACAEPAAPSHGSVTGGGGNYPGTDATFSCDRGYHLLPVGQQRSTCQTDGTHAPAAPTCTPCTHVSHCNDVRCTDDSDQACSSATECDAGYTKNRQCEGVTCETPTAPICTASLSSVCGSAIHGKVTGGGGTYPGTDAAYTCDDGYTMVGSSTAQCDVQGHYTRPSCSPKSCGDATQIAPTESGGCVGEQHYQDGNVVCTATCRNGYTSTGIPGAYQPKSQAYICQADGTFDQSKLACQREACPGPFLTRQK
jgi:hypothetical protein